jgi:hypothetical protein
LKITNKGSFFKQFNDVLYLLDDTDDSPKDNDIMIYYNDILNISDESLPSVSPPSSKEKEEIENTIESLSCSLTRDLSSDFYSRNYIPKTLLLEKTNLDMNQRFTNDTLQKSFNMPYILNKGDFEQRNNNNRYII